LNSRGETPVAVSRTPFVGDSRLPPYRTGLPRPGHTDGIPLF